MAENAKGARSKWHPASIVQRIKKFFSDQRSEIRKIVWPSRRQVLNNTGIVLGFIVIAAVAAGSFDAVLTLIVRLLLGG